jgi:hypothetical protein
MTTPQEHETDAMQNLVESVVNSETDADYKFGMLTVIEPLIEDAYFSGQTTVKPVSAMTIDDIIN